MLCLLDAKAKVFAIRMCKSNEPKGFKFSKPRGEQKGVVTISSKNLLEPLRAATGEDWVPGKRYRVRGFWVADAKTMCFDLNEGVQEDVYKRQPQGQPHIKVWFTLYSIHLQVQCYIQVMVPAGAINKIKCWKLCVAGVITNYEI